ncbi:hypothetical protein PTKIN_Ptkin14bG0165300 [Pterospermum kingtungense]
MKKQVCSKFLVLICFIFLFVSIINAQSCGPSGNIRGKKPPPGQCNTENDSDCCKEGKLYTTHNCSPPVSSHTKATLTLNSFDAGGDGGGASECDNRFHKDDKTVVALSTGWFDDMIPHQFHKTLWNGPIIGAFVESRSVAEKGYLEKGYLVLDKVRSESRPKRGRGLPCARRVRSEAVQSEAVRGRPVSQGVWSDTIPQDVME